MNDVRSPRATVRRIACYLLIAALVLLVGVSATRPAAAFVTLTTFNTTAAFDAGTKVTTDTLGVQPVANGYLSVFTGTDSPTVGANKLQLASVLGDDFTSPATDGNLRTWNWNPCLSTAGGTYSNVIGGGKLQQTVQANPGGVTGGATGEQLNSIVTPNGDLTVQAFFDPTIGAGRVGEAFLSVESSGSTTTVNPNCAAGNTVWIKATINGAGGYVLGFYLNNAQQGVDTGAFVTANYLRITQDAANPKNWAGYYSPDGAAWTQIGTTASSNLGASLYLSMELTNLGFVSANPVVVAWTHWSLSGTDQIQYSRTNDGGGNIWHSYVFTGQWVSPAVGGGQATRVQLVLSGSASPPELNSNLMSVDITINIQGGGAFTPCTGLTPAGTVNCDFGQTAVASVVLTFHDGWNVGSGAFANIIEPIGVTSVAVMLGSQATMSFTTSPTTPKSGQLVAFTATVSAGDYAVLSWTWDFGDGNFQVGGNPVTHTYAADGVYTAILTWSTAVGGGSATRAVTIAPTGGGGGSTPSPTQAQPLDVKLIFVNCTEINMTDARPEAVNGALWIWFWGDGNQTTTNERSASHVYAVPSNYTVVLKVQDISGRIDTFAGTVDLRGGSCQILPFAYLLGPYILAIAIVMLVAVILQLLVGKTGRSTKWFIAFVIGAFLFIVFFVYYGWSPTLPNVFNF